MTFGTGDGYQKILGNVDQHGADELVKEALNAGVNFYDTADIYAGGESERILGQSFKNLGVSRQDAVIGTKAFHRMGAGVNSAGASRGHIMNAVEASLKRLQTDYIDLYQIHGNDSITPVEETIRALDDLVTQGKVRYVGVSNWQAWRIARSLGISELKELARFESLQAYYSIAGRDLEREIVPLLESEKVGLLVWGPLAGGLLSGKFNRNNQKPEDSRRSVVDFPIVDKDRAWNIIDVVKPIADAHNSTPAQVALAWLLSRPVVTSVLMGAKRIDQLKDNLGAIHLKLNEDELKSLDEVSQLPPEYPGWMQEVQNVDRLGPLNSSNFVV